MNTVGHIFVYVVWAWLALTIVVFACEGIANWRARRKNLRMIAQVIGHGLTGSRREPVSEQDWKEYDERRDAAYVAAWRQRYDLQHPVGEQDRHAL